MKAMLSRRAALTAGAGLFVALGLPGAPGALAQTNLSNPPATDVDSMIVISADGRCAVLTSKTEFGQGILASLAQIAAEELDLPYEMVEVPHPDTDRMPDHGLTGGSATLQVVGPRVRIAAATARAALVRMGAERLGVTLEAVETADGAVRVKNAPDRRAPYAELIGGRRFDLQPDPNARVKPRAEWKVAGRPQPRPELLAKLTGGGDYIHNLRLPGMLHARVIHAPGLGAEPASVDASSIAEIPARIVRRNGLLAVVAEREWDAVRAARDLKVEWTAGKAIPSMEEVYDAARRTPEVRQDVTVNRGNPETALTEAAMRLEATYSFGVQTHGTIGPSCAVAQFEGGRLTVHSGTQAPFDLREQIAKTLGLGSPEVRVVYHHSSGCFGRNGLEDAAAECAALAMELAPRPVRLQWMRHDEHGSEPKGPPVVMDLKGGITAEGRMAAWDSEGWVPHSTVTLLRTTASQLLDKEDGGAPGSGNWHANSNPPYDGIPAAKTVVHRIAETPFRPSWIRTPGRVQNCFAVESFTDELAAAARKDPVRFRLDHLSDPRGRAVIEAAARIANWDERPSPRGGEGSGNFRRGRGIAYIRYDNTRTYVACVIAAEVNLDNGAIRATDAWIAEDCGQVINPDGIRMQAEGCVVQTLSRCLREEIAWEGNRITTLDWASYPLITFPEVPRITVEILDRPDQPMWGAGEPAAAVIAPAFGNAIFDATGARLRRAPFTPERVKAALNGAAKTPLP
ncbi:xanthine dehydrogenase family protein molybdopterin-binding subunit [Roseomonas populi]|uniref:Molybdopterin-dependent oxidoreductase n=1 Tax=Roseomonas populi TaxID=3121582 RepID=A0ABT1X382_9PROT|nr:molybdopterin cofactor-binding domain-containing protein [Roseomonas pecuniae]MCR0982565.1 molybdopterin-dependent oxidoreductase [Roseomonas pecuniae]